MVHVMLKVIEWQFVCYLKGKVEDLIMPCGFKITKITEKRVKELLTTVNQCEI